MDHITCEDCAGTGKDPGGLDPIYPEDCPACQGTGAEPDLLADLTLAERMVASIAVVNYRKQNGNAHVAEPFRTMLEKFGGVA